MLYIGIALYPKAGMLLFIAPREGGAQLRQSSSNFLPQVSYLPEFSHFSDNKKPHPPARVGGLPPRSNARL